MGIKGNEASKYKSLHEEDQNSYYELYNEYCKIVSERDMLQKRLYDMRKQREHWANEATKMYRLFFSHDEYCVPDKPSEMVAVAVRTLQDKLDKTNGENKEAENIDRRAERVDSLVQEDDQKAYEGQQEGLEDRPID